MCFGQQLEKGEKFTLVESNSFEISEPLVANFMKLLCCRFKTPHILDVMSKHQWPVWGFACSKPAENSFLKTVLPQSRAPDHVNLSLFWKAKLGEGWSHICKMLVDVKWSGCWSFKSNCRCLLQDVGGFRGGSRISLKGGQMLYEGANK